MPDPVETVNKPCAAGCGAIVTVEKLPNLLAKRWSFLREMEFLCDECFDRQEREQIEQEAAEAQRKAAVGWRFSSGIPKLLREVTWAQVEDAPGRAEAIESAKRWGAGELQGLVLCGPVGTGKTFIAAAAAWERMEREPVRWYSVPALIAHGLADFKSIQRKQASETLLGTMPVVLDDIDKVKATEWVASQLFVAIDGRVQNDGAFIVTTNLLPEEVEDVLGPALASRLEGAGEFRIVEGDDRRLL